MRFFTRQIAVCSESCNSATVLLPHSLEECFNQRGCLFEEDLIEWAAQFCDPSKLFLDVGAHTGTYSIKLAPRCKRVYAFEPQRSTFYGLCGSIALSGFDNVICLNHALGDVPGKFDLNIVSEDGGGSSLISQEFTTLRSESVSVKRLDDLEWDDPVGFVKIDVEGFESEVIEGGQQLLMRDHPVILFEDNSGRCTITDWLYTHHPHHRIPQHVPSHC